MSEHQAFAQIRKRKWNALMKKSVEEVAEELLKLAKEKFPDLVKLQIPQDFIDYFWASKGVGYPRSPETEDFYRQVNAIANLVRMATTKENQSIQSSQETQALTNEPPEELAKELIEFAQKNLPEDFARHRYLDHGVKYAFWEEKGVRWSRDSRLALFTRRVESIAEDMLQVERQRHNLELLSELLKGKTVLQLIEQMVTYAEVACSGSELDELMIQNMFENFWIENYPEVSRELWRLRSVRETVEPSVKHTLVLNALVKWIEDEGITRPVKADVRSFLLDKGLKVKWDDQATLLRDAKRRIATCVRLRFKRPKERVSRDELKKLDRRYKNRTS